MSISASGKQRGPGRPREFDSDVVLEKVANIFWELGYDAADTETLSRITGLSKPSLYNAFGSKEDLFVAAIKHYRQTRSQASLNALTSAGTPSAGTRDFFLHFAENVAGHDHPKGCLIMSIALPLCDRLPKVAAILESAPKESSARMIAFFQDQVAQGKLPKDFDCMASVMLIQDLSAAMVMQARAGAPLDALKQKADRNAQLVLFAGGANTQ